MSNKSDRWIRRMSKENGMIEPFSEQQVRVANGHRIVSYGTSSYGYDVRCAEDFKIFTNINSTIVDPKAFDEKSFVDFRGPVCIIPPNSFALASTVEYFRIPRSVLTVCLGKCVTGDTRVVDAETGAYMPITEMRFGKSTLALENWKLKPAKVSAFVPQGRKEVFELRTRTGLRIRATANHPFLKFDGWTALRDLRVGDRIAAAGAVPVFGKTPIPDGEAGRLGSMMSSGAHEGSIPQSIFTAPKESVRLFLRSLLSGMAAPEALPYTPGIEAGGYKYPGALQKGSYSHPDFDAFQGNTVPALDALHDVHTDDVVLELVCNSYRFAEDVHHLLLRFGITSLIRGKNAVAGTSCYTIQLSSEELRHLSEGDGPRSDDTLWDVVDAITPAGFEEVFDISIPNLHNFFANGLIVHNSTYARCFSGDTRVALVNGSAPTLEEMARRYENGEIFRGYSIAKDGRLIVGLLDAPRFIGRDSLLEIELDNGERIHATPDHQFMQRDGQLVEAHLLRPQDSLMPLDRNAHRGEEAVYQPADGHWYLTEGMHQFGASQRLSHQASYRNHKVAAVREIPGDHDVYCLTVPEAGNFALEAGVFVKNCGIIVNVTPLEPEWEGHVTLEFSNTTPLPAKIYANEGVAQMLFFESDEVCETSYKDRGGKYQGQRGVTLPKT
jgi:deoxycytidine triphosphate deaminase